MTHLPEPEANVLGDGSLQRYPAPTQVASGLSATTGGLNKGTNRLFAFAYSSTFW